eukprot:CCRYP_006643-RF/>CCRYP_006643-RF protein AED:0.13 eAED:0.13 QI:170/0.76/0.85/1/0.61/0.71/14/191/939
MNCIRATLFICLAVFASGQSEHHRRRLTPDVSIINALNEQLAIGVEHPRFTLTADFSSGGGLFQSAEQVEIDVVLTKPSVSQSTSFSVDGGMSTSVQTTSKIFVSDQIANETLTKQFAILTVDESKGLVSGLVQKDGKLLKLEQRQGGPTFVTEVNYDPPKDWECTVVPDRPDPVAKDPADPDGRRLNEKHDHENHQDHDHAHHHHHHTLNLSDAQNKDIFAHLGNINRNVLRNRRRLYATDTFPNKWSYQVDLYIEIDGGLVLKHDPNDAVNMPNTIAYVNALITAASSVYEKEVDTHSKTTLYDSQTSTSGALDVMVNQYSSQSWHYVDPITGESPDLHHAILYKSLGGGIAYLGAVCNSNYGYGVSAGIRGSMSDLGGEMFWDISVIMHEIGHNFGADHTHDTSGFNPKVDACGDGQCTSVVNGQYISAGDATIMSYCHLCSGGESNIGFTFGGQWNGGDRSNVNNWINWTFVQVDFTDIPLSAGTKRAFYIATSAQLIASDDTSNPLASDDHLKLLNPAGILPSTEFQYLYSGTYSWVGSMSYSISPRKAPSKKPTLKPSSQPTLPIPKPTMKPTAKPTLQPTNKPTSMSPTVKPTTPSPVAGFSKVGQGYCLDASNEWYSAVKSFALPLSTTDSYCLGWCSQNLHSNLVAVEINRDAGSASMFCYCSFSGGAVPNEINLSGYSPAASTIVTYPGVGAIEATDATTSAVCYRNTNYNSTPNPTPLPSVKPTPNPTLKPTSQPTPLPSLNPTMKPTIAPTRKPTTQPTPQPSLRLTMKPTSAPSRKPITGAPTSSPNLPIAKEVRLHSITGEQIQVFEVEVYSAGVNVAQGKIATQSSTLNSFAASRAVDGIRNSFSHTNDNSFSWWKVDLGSAFSIESVNIVNRWCGNPSDKNGCLCRLSHTILSLFDENGKWVTSFSLDDTCGKLELTKSFSDN